MANLSKDNYQKGDKLLFLQIHNIIPILLLSIALAVLSWMVFSVFTEQKNDISQIKEEIRMLQKEQVRQSSEAQAIREKLSVTPTLTPTPTQSVRRVIPTPTPQGE